MSGQGPAIDEQGNLYVITGNADFNPAQGSYGDSVIKLSPDLKVLDYFTPFNEQNLDNWDEDLGSCGVLLIPGTNLALAGSKEGKLYLLDRDNMGKFQAGSDDQIRQWFTAFGGHLHGSPIFYDSAEGRLVYLWSENDRLKAYKLNAQDLLDVTPYRTGQIIAGTRLPSGQFFDMAAQLRGGHAVPEFNGGNTTLVVVATDATLSKSECRKVAQMAQDGMARAIKPIHTPFDCDVIFTVATNQRPAPAMVQLGSVAADVVAAAIERSVAMATSMAGMPAMRDI
jgi:hypothetical protein